MIAIPPAFVAHRWDHAPDIPRQQAWELLDETITQTPIAKNLILLGDFNTSLHARKEGEEDHIGEHTFGRGSEFLALRNLQTSLENRQQRNANQHNKNTRPSH